VINEAPHHEEISCAQLSTMWSKCMGG